jgi:hypothetical protein
LGSSCVVRRVASTFWDLKWLKRQAEARRSWKALTAIRTSTFSSMKINVNSQLTQMRHVHSTWDAILSIRTNLDKTTFLTGLIENKTNTEEKSVKICRQPNRIYTLNSNLSHRTCRELRTSRYQIMLFWLLKNGLLMKFFTFVGNISKSVFWWIGLLLTYMYCRFIYARINVYLTTLSRLRFWQIIGANIAAVIKDSTTQDKLTLKHQCLNISKASMSSQSLRGGCQMSDPCWYLH